MIHTSINALIGLKLTSFIKDKNLLSTAIIIGLILPDLDFILDFILSLFLNYDFLYNPYISNSIFHSLFMIPFLSLLILIYLEYTNQNNSYIVIGLSLGMLAHVIIDVISFNSIGIFFPLFDLKSSFGLTNYFNIQFSSKIIKIFYTFDFFFYRLYTLSIINLIIINKIDNFRIIKKLTIFMKIQLYIFLLFLLLIYFDVSNNTFSSLFGLFYTLCFLMTFYMTCKSRTIIN